MSSFKNLNLMQSMRDRVGVNSMSRGKDSFERWRCDNEIDREEEKGGSKGLSFSKCLLFALETFGPLMSKTRGGERVRHSFDSCISYVNSLHPIRPTSCPSMITVDQHLLSLLQFDSKILKDGKSVCRLRPDNKICERDDDH